MLVRELMAPFLDGFKVSRVTLSSFASEDIVTDSVWDLVMLLVMLLAPVTGGPEPSTGVTVSDEDTEEEDIEPEEQFEVTEGTSGCGECNLRGHPYITQLFTSLSRKSQVKNKYRY